MPTTYSGWSVSSYTGTVPSFDWYGAPAVPKPAGRVKKHIKYKAELVRPLMQNVLVTILEQTHTCSDFGKFGWGFAHNGYSLLSYGSPMTQGGYGCYMRGNYPEYDNQVMRMRLEHYKLFRAAVEAYNSYFSGVNEEKRAGKVKHTGKSKAEAPPEQWRDKHGKERFYR